MVEVRSSLENDALNDRHLEKSWLAKERSLHEDEALKDGSLKKVGWQR